MIAWRRCRLPIAVFACCFAGWIILSTWYARQLIESASGGWCGTSILYAEHRLKLAGISALLLPVLYALTYGHRLALSLARIATVTAVTWWVCNYYAIYPRP